MILDASASSLRRTALLPSTWLLRRPGRFDHEIEIGPRRGGAAHPKIHTRDMPTAPELDLERPTASTPVAIRAPTSRFVP